MDDIGHCIDVPHDGFANLVLVCIHVRKKLRFYKNRSALCRSFFLHHRLERKHHIQASGI